MHLNRIQSDVSSDINNNLPEVDPGCLQLKWLFKYDIASFIREDELVVHSNQYNFEECKFLLRSGLNPEFSRIYVA